MSNIDVVFRNGGWFFVATILACLTVIWMGIRFQNPLPQPSHFDPLIFECWAYPCKMERVERYFWEREVMLPLTKFSGPLAVGSQHTIVAAPTSRDAYLWHGDDVPRKSLTLGNLFSSPVTAVGVGPDDTIVTGYQDGSFALWSDQGEFKFRHHIAREPIISIAVGANDSVLLAHENGPLHYLQAPTHVVESIRVTTLETITSATAVAFGTDNTILSGHVDGSVVIWAPTGERQNTLLSAVSAPVSAVALDQFKIVVAAYRDGRVYSQTLDGVRVGDTTLKLPMPFASAIAIGTSGEIVTAFKDGRFLPWTPSGFAEQPFSLKLLGSITSGLWTLAIAIGLLVGSYVYFRIAFRPRQVASILEETDSDLSRRDLGSGRYVVVSADGDVLVERQTAPTLGNDQPIWNPRDVTASMASTAQAVAGLIANPNCIGPLTVCLYGKWGTGKSTFVNLVTRNLRRNYLTCVFFDAWHHQNENHLFAALMEQIRRSWRPRPHVRGKDMFGDAASFRESLLTAADNVYFYLLIWKSRITKRPFTSLWFVFFLLISVSLLSLTTLCSFGSLWDSQCSIGDTVALDAGSEGSALLAITFMSAFLGASIFLWNGPWNILRAFPVTPISLLNPSSGWLQSSQSLHQLSFRYRFQVAFREVCNVLQAIDRNLVIIVDDLDRCEGKQISQILEAINFLTSSGTCFVFLAMDEEKVKDALNLVHSTVTKGASNQHYADLFLEKIINLHLEVPAVTAEELRSVLKGKQP